MKFQEIFAVCRYENENEDTNNKNTYSVPAKQSMVTSKDYISGMNQIIVRRDNENHVIRAFVFNDETRECIHKGYRKQMSSI